MLTSTRLGPQKQNTTIRRGSWANHTQGALSAKVARQSFVWSGFVLARDFSPFQTFADHSVTLTINSKTAPSRRE